MAARLNLRIRPGLTIGRGATTESEPEQSGWATAVNHGR